MIAVVDDDEGMSRALQRLLGSAGWQVERYASGEALLATRDPAVHSCILLDVRLPGTNGLNVFADLVAREVPTPVIFLTAYPDVRTAVQAIRRGAVEFFEKPFAPSELLEAVERAVELDARIRRERVARAETRARLALLTAREREVLSLILRGRLNKQIAADLAISQRTVEVHRYRLMKKLRADSVVDLMSLAFRAEDDILPETFRRRGPARRLPWDRGMTEPAQRATGERL